MTDHESGDVLSAKDKRKLDQSVRALVRVSDWLSQLDQPLDGRVSDLLGELLFAVEQARGE